MVKILLTGASGFIGAACRKTLEARGLEVLAPSSAALNLLDGESVRTYLAAHRPSHLLHAAWRAVHGDVMASADNLLWLQASLGLVKAFREAGGTRFAGLGSSAEYDWSYGVCRTGITPLNPSTPYGAAKHALRLGAESYSKAVGLSFVWPRVFFIYGPGEHASRLSVYVLKSLLAGETADLTHGRQIRDYLYITDVAEGVAAALLSAQEGETDIASGAPFAVRDIVGEIGRQVGRADLLAFGAKPSPAHDLPVVLGDGSHARMHIGWAPRFTLEQGIAEMIAWGRETFPH